MLRELPPLSVACLAQAISKDDDLPEPLLTWLDPLSTFLLSMSTEKRVGTVGFYYQTILAYLRYAKAEPVARRQASRAVPYTLCAGTRSPEWRKWTCFPRRTWEGIRTARRRNST